MIQHLSKPLDRRMHELFKAPSLDEVTPSELLREAGRVIKMEDMTDAVLCEILMTRSSDSLVNCFWLSNGRAREMRN